MSTKPLPSQERLHELLELDYETGLLTWRPRGIFKFDARWANRPALRAVGKHGYRQGQLQAQWVRAARVIFKMVSGLEPPHVDHRDGNTLNDRPDNLRASNAVHNQRNQFLRCNNKSGRVGVAEKKIRGNVYWQATIRIEGKAIHLGQWPFTERGFFEACAARAAAEIKFGFSPRHGEARP